MCQTMIVIRCLVNSQRTWSRPGVSGFGGAGEYVCGGAIGGRLMVGVDIAERRRRRRRRRRLVFTPAGKR